jgi:penicillin-binding protein 1C
MRPDARRIILFAAAAALIAGAMALGIYIKARPPLLDKTAFSTAFYDRTGHLLRLTLAADGRYRLYTPLEKISPDLITATLMQEDRYFFAHPGVNPVSLLRGAFETYVRRRRWEGGSTISMQVVRLRDHINTRTLSGKALQILRALQLEHHYSKDRILEAYLNLAPYGGNIEGVGAASLIYFGQKAQGLALPESLALAVIPQNPLRRFPLSGDISAWRGARLRLYHALPARYNIYARRMDLPLTVRPLAQLPFLAPHFVDGLTPSPGDVATTLDLDTQHLLEQHIGDWIDRQRGLGVDNASAILIHFPTMEIRGLVGSADFFDKKIDGQVDGTAARRSPGSTLKPFIYALAMDQGVIHPNTLLDDDPAYFAEYRPVNFDGQFIGKIPARDALVLSRNIPAITLNTKIRPDLYDFLQNAGAAFPKPKNYYGLSLAVGGAEIDMRTLARLYAMLANGGTLRDIKDGTNPRTAPDRTVLSPEAALLTVQMLGHPPPDRLDFTAGGAGLPVYWKTGTSSGFHDAWTAGIFGPYVLIVWTGHFDGRPNPAFVGVERAAPLFFELARALDAQEHLHDLIGPALAHRNVSMVEICAATGAPGTCAAKQTGWFIPGKSPIAAPVSAALTPPKILSPRDGISYVASHQSDERLQIPLKAEDPKGQDTLFWFDGTKLIGVAGRRTPLLWTPDPGRHTIHLVNAAGQSATETITVMSAE